MQSLFGKHLNVITVWDVYTCTYAYQQINKSTLTLLTHICTHTHTHSHIGKAHAHTHAWRIYTTNKQITLTVNDYTTCTDTRQGS